MMSKSPLKMLTFFIECPFTLAKKVVSLFFMNCLFRSIGNSMKSAAGEGKPLLILTSKKDNTSLDEELRCWGSM